MNVDLLSIINNTEKEIAIEGNSSFQDNDCLVDWTIDGKAEGVSGAVNITAYVEATVKTKCAKCLKPLTFDIKVDIDERVGEEGVELSGTVLNVDNIVKNNIVVELPIRFLCKEDCEGICSICGADLNIAKCDCKHEQFDERFAVLKQLLDSGNKPE